MAKSIEPGSTSIKGTVRSEGGQSRMNAAHKRKLNGGDECAVSSEYAQMRAAIVNPIIARLRVSRRRLRFTIVESMVERNSSL